MAKQLAGMDAALTAFATVYRLPKRARRVMSIAARKKDSCCAKTALGKVQSRTEVRARAKTAQLRVLATADETGDQENYDNCSYQTVL